jgi:hypothetical protein
LHYVAFRAAFVYTNPLTQTRTHNANLSVVVKTLVGLAITIVIQKITGFFNRVRGCTDGLRRIRTADDDTGARNPLASDICFSFAQFAQAKNVIIKAIAVVI